MVSRPGRYGHSSHLPPVDVWKIHPEKIEPVALPTDDRGFILPHQSIELLLSFFDEDYTWPVDWGANKSSDLRPNDHHFYWPKENYEPYKFFWPLRSVPRQFRGLTTNRGLIPKQFHNVIHEISLPPNTPSKYHMRRYIKSYEIARS